MPGIEDIIEDNKPIDTDASTDDMNGFTSGDTIAIIPEETGNSEPVLTSDDDEVTEEQAETIVAATSSIYIVAAKMLKELHIINTDEFTQLIAECGDKEEAA